MQRPDADRRRLEFVLAGYAEGSSHELARRTGRHDALYLLRGDCSEELAEERPCRVEGPALNPHVPREADRFAPAGGVGHDLIERPAGEGPDTFLGTHDGELRAHRSDIESNAQSHSNLPKAAGTARGGGRNAISLYIDRI